MYNNGLGIKIQSYLLTAHSKEEAKQYVERHAREQDCVIGAIQVALIEATPEQITLVCSS